jgi:hypothetical protein
LLGELRLLEIVAGVEQSFTAAHHVHDTGLPVGTLPLQPVGQRRQAARLVEPLALER